MMFNHHTEKNILSEIFKEFFSDSEPHIADFHFVTFFFHLTFLDRQGMLGKVAGNDVGKKLTGQESTP